MLHLEMAAFARATCAAIENGALKVVAAHLAFIDELFDDARRDLENAIYVSYPEKVFLGRDDERYRSARSALSNRLQAAIETDAAVKLKALDENVCAASVPIEL